MRSVAQDRREARNRRHRRVRTKVRGREGRPRLCVFRSLKHIYAQLIDDDASRCLLTVSSLSPEVRDKIKETKGKIPVSEVVGELLGEKAKAAGYESVTFDRGGYLYHGRVKALAEGARKAGLSF